VASFGSSSKLRDASLDVDAVTRDVSFHVNSILRVGWCQVYLKRTPIAIDDHVTLATGKLLGVLLTPTLA